MQTIVGVGRCGVDRAWFCSPCLSSVRLHLTFGSFPIPSTHRFVSNRGRKSALAGLWWGGGKGIIVKDPSQITSDVEAEKKKRRLLMKDYGTFLTSLRGCYYTAEDVGVNEGDMNLIFKTTR